MGPFFPFPGDLAKQEARNPFPFFFLLADVRSCKLQRVPFRHFEHGGNFLPLRNTCRLKQQLDSYSPESSTFSAVDGIACSPYSQSLSPGFLAPFFKFSFSRGLADYQRYC